MANIFKVGDKVKTKPSVGAIRLNGTVKYVACHLATISGGKKCDKKTCTHLNKDNIWVEWPAAPGKILSYHYSELDYDASQPPAAKPVLPSADEMKTPSTGDSDKDEYINKAKNAIDKIVGSSKPKQEVVDFFRHYNGFTTIKYDRNGRPFLRETVPVEIAPIKDDEIDWDVYNGSKKGSVKKVAV